MLQANRALLHLVKPLGIAAIAALALLALAGPGAASAAQICKQVPSGGDGQCPGRAAEKQIAKGESFEVSATDAVLTSPVTDISCANSSVRVRMTSENGISTLEGKITALSFDGCETAGGTACTVTLGNLPFETVFHLADVLVFDEAGILFRINCGFLVSCEIEGREQLIELEAGVLVASDERPYAKRGAFCPSVPRFDATYSPPSGLTLLP
jgi:hypothetical protein